MMNRNIVVVTLMFVVLNVAMVQASDSGSAYTALGCVAALAVGGGTVYNVAEDCKNEFTKKGPRPETSFTDDLKKVATIAVTLPLAVACLQGSELGKETFTTATIGGVAFLVMNRLVARHDLPFWPMAGAIFTYVAQKSVCVFFGIPCLSV